MAFWFKNYLHTSTPWLHFDQWHPLWQIHLSPRFLQAPLSLSKLQGIAELSLLFLPADYQLALDRRSVFLLRSRHVSGNAKFSNELDEIVICISSW